MVGCNGNVIDLEMGLPQRPPLQMDLVCLEQNQAHQWQVVFWEAKSVSDSRLFPVGGHAPEVIDQLMNYTSWFHQDVELLHHVAWEYGRNCRRLVELHAIAAQLRPGIEPLGPGIIAVTDAAPPLIDVHPRLLIDARQIAPGWPTVFMGEHPEAPDDQIPGVVALQHHWQNQQQQRVAQGLQPLPALRVKIVRRRSQMILE